MGRFGGDGKEGNGVGKGADRDFIAQSEPRAVTNTARSQTGLDRPVRSWTGRFDPVWPFFSLSWSVFNVGKSSTFIPKVMTSS